MSSCLLFGNFRKKFNVIPAISFQVRNFQLSIHSVGSVTSKYPQLNMANGQKLRKISGNRWFLGFLDM